MARIVAEGGVRKSKSAENKNTSPPSPKKKATTYPDRIDIPDITMGNTSVGDEDPGSPPPLFYPESDEEVPLASNLRPPASQHDSNRTPVLESAASQPAPAGVTTTRQKAGGTTLVSPVPIEEWKTTLEKIRQEVEAGTAWTTIAVKSNVRALGIFAWWVEVNIKIISEKGVDWGSWKEKLFAQWKANWPTLSEDRMVIMLTEVKDLEETLRRKKRWVSGPQPMDVDNEARKTNLPEPPNPYPTPPASDTSKPETPLSKPQMKEKAIEDLHHRLDELDARISRTTKVLKERTEELCQEAERGDDLVADLKYRKEERDAITERAKGAGKRSYRKKNSPLAFHKYPTRLATSQADQVLQISIKEYGDIEEKIRDSERKITEVRQEIADLQEELEHVKEVSTRIDTINQTLQAFQNSQVKINVEIFKSLASFRDVCFDALQPRVDRHDSELQDLYTRFAKLCAIAVHVIQQVQKSSSAASDIAPLPFNPEHLAQRSHPAPAYSLQANKLVAP